MEITVTVKFVGPNAMERAAQYFLPSGAKAAAEVPTAPAPVPAPSSEAPAQTKRGKKAKPEPVIAPGTVDGPAEVRQDAKATKEQAQTALEKVFSDKGLQTARDLLSRYGVQRLQDMKPEQYRAFVEHAGRVLTGGEV